MLEMTQRFDVDVAQLESNFKRLQRAVHPDLFASRGPKEQEASAQSSSLLNVAYKILRNPASRAQYLLQLNGIDAIGEKTGSEAVSPALLMQVMEAREVVAEPGSDPHAVFSIKSGTDNAIRRSLVDLGLAFDAQDFQKAAAITVALQYYTRLSHEAGEWIASREQQERESSSKLR